MAALAVARASYVAGCSSTSNVLAGRRYGIPVFGTHAHSWVMSFDSELEAFRGGLAPGLTAATGMDAVAHCIEDLPRAMTSTHRPPKALALDGLRPLLLAAEYQRHQWFRSQNTVCRLIPWRGMFSSGAY